MPKAHIEVVLGMSVVEAQTLLDLLSGVKDGHATIPIWEVLRDTLDAVGIEA